MGRFFRSVSLRLAALVCCVSCSGHPSSGARYPDSQNHSDPNRSTPPHDGPLGTPPSFEGGVFRSGPLPSLENETGMILPDGGVVPIIKKGESRFIPIFMTVTKAHFDRLITQSSLAHFSDDQKRNLIASKLHENIALLKGLCPVLDVRTDNDIGLGTGLMDSSCYRAKVMAENGKSNLFPNGFLVSPRVAQKIPKATLTSSYKRHVETDAASLSLVDPQAFMGLSEVGIPQFLRQLKSDYGITVDGSSTRVGVVDTGVTLAHPAFSAVVPAPGLSRIHAMKDFTGEGRIYFSPRAQFELRAQGGRYTLWADFYLGGASNHQKPEFDSLSRVENMPFKASPEIEQLLETQGVSFRLGVFQEKLLNGEDDTFDLNQNGDFDDEFWVLLAETKNKERLFFIDLNPRKISERKEVTCDFSASQAIRDWNQSRQFIQIYSEKFAIEFKNDELFDNHQAGHAVVSASMVGIDPGSHGTHVSGIIGAKSLFQGQGNGEMGEISGVAPGVQLMVNRVCANTSGCDALLGIADLAKNGAQVINMSLGGSSFYNDGFGVEETIINRLTEQYNVLFVISAGNSGPALQSVGSPSTAPSALSVGAAASPNMIAAQYKWPVWFQNPFVLFFSSRGPTAAGGFKPEVLAPGTQLSSVPLNTGNGGRSGLDVFWGTSMAAPLVSGSAALLIDAVEKMNQKSPQRSLRLSSRNLKRILMESATPVHTLRYFPDEQKTQGRGDSTWIDQGAGLINLVKAWDLVMKLPYESQSTLRVNSPSENHNEFPIEPRYLVRVSQINPNGQVYDGTNAESAEPRYGQGVWLSEVNLPKIVPVQIMRALPQEGLASPFAGDLATLLNTTAETFDLKLEIQGSASDWIGLSDLQSQECRHQPQASVTLIGSGVNPDNQQESQGRTRPFGASTLYLCIQAQKVAALPPGDHGALIRAYRRNTLNPQRRDALPAFIVPVYLTRSHASLEHQQGFSTQEVVGSFQIKRHYIRIPKGTSSVKIQVSVPFGDGVPCSAVELTLREAHPLESPPELKKHSLIRSCDPNGTPLPMKNEVGFVRMNPRPGIWELHVMGKPQFPSSAYAIRVDYLKLGERSQNEIAIDPQSLKGTFYWEVTDSSPVAHIPYAQKSLAQWEGLRSDYAVEAPKEGEMRDLPAGNGLPQRRYPSFVKSVKLDTVIKDSNEDIDIEILECALPFDSAVSPEHTTEPPQECVAIVRSAGSGSDESVTFEPKPHATYVLRAHGFRGSREDSHLMEIKELWFSQQVEKADLVATSGGSLGAMDFSIQFSKAHSLLLNSDEYLSGKFSIFGVLQLKTAEDELLYLIPVWLKPHAPN